MLTHWFRLCIETGHSPLHLKKCSVIQQHFPEMSQSAWLFNEVISFNDSVHHLIILPLSQRYTCRYIYICRTHITSPPTPSNCSCVTVAGYHQAPAHRCSMTLVCCSPNCMCCQNARRLKSSKETQIIISCQETIHHNPRLKFHEWLHL